MSFPSGQLGRGSESTVAELRLLRGAWHRHSRMAKRQTSYKASSPQGPKPSTVMEPSYSYPQDDYALTILTQAAMHTTNNTTDNSSHSRSGYDNPTSGLTTADFHAASLSSASEITNHQLDPGHREIRSNGTQSHSLTPELPNNYNHLVLPHSSTAPRMETLAFNPAQAGGHNSFMDSAFRGIGSEISRNYANNLGILNAESYSDHVSPTRFDARTQASEPTLAFGMIPHHQMDHSSREDMDEIDTGARRRKKPRIEPKSDDDDEKKKSRGRPRVDTKDETAADRRRTQIRMAQRAYRHRKETTISSLEKQVQELRGTNEEMSNIFIALYDFAVGKGLLQREPEFGQQLQSTTERFLALAKASSDELNHDENHVEEPEKQDEPENTRPKKKSRKSSPKTRQQPQEPKAASPRSPVWGGFPIGKSQTPVEEINMDYQPNHYETRSRQQDLQIITRPTEDNASFPWDFMDNMDLQQYRVEVPSTEDFSSLFLPQSQPALPDTFSYTEFTFARRLQRGSMEAALRLVSDPNPEPGHFERVFGFRLTYESREAIIGRAKTLLGRTSKDSLQNWSAPFHHIGNAGTHYPMREGDVNDELMPKIRTGYSMGPFSEAIALTQDQFFDDDGMKCNFPGFEGEFFDANDVEGYLRSRGLDISPSADLVTAQLDLSSLVEVKSPKSISDSSPATVSPRTPKTPIANLVNDADSFSNPYKLDVNALPFPLGFASWDSEVADKDGSNIDPIFYNMTEQNSARETPNGIENNSGEGQMVTLDVRTLLSELISRAVCLHRSPGFRPSDVNAAIVAAANNSGY